ncbi:hypothetical protein GGF46_002390 [Coemansia sp. RSA 552]|nr:hypothetical protein GGF46_002390 [Coemansia sp. RSA 552]
MNRPAADDAAGAGRGPERRALCSLPFEILCHIFVLAQWPSLATVSRVFLAASQTAGVRARYFLVEFGRAAVLDGTVGLYARRPHMLSPDVVLLLLSLHADPRAGDQWILRHACTRGWTLVVRQLLSMRVRSPAGPQDPPQGPPQGSPGSHEHLDSWRGAARPPPPALGPPLLDINANYGASLCLAASNGHGDIVRTLVGAGADLDAEDGAPLIESAGACRPEMTRLLLELGADARAAASQALRAAVLVGDAAIDCIRMLLDAGADARAADDSCLLTACYKGDGSLPPPPDSRDAPADLLQYASTGLPDHGPPSTVLALRQPRRYRNISRGLPRLDARPSTSHVAVLRLLLAHGVDPNARAGRALCYTSAKGWIRCTALLLAHGADPRVQNDLPLRDAARHGHLPIIRLLLRAGANVHAAGDDDSPLLNAARAGHLDVVREILARGASADSPAGLLALRAAARGAWVAVVRELAAAGADTADPEFNAIALRSPQLRRALAIPSPVSLNIPQ